MVTTRYTLNFTDFYVSHCMKPNIFKSLIKNSKKKLYLVYLLT